MLNLIAEHSLLFCTRLSFFLFLFLSTFASSLLFFSSRFPLRSPSIYLVRKERFPPHHQNTKTDAFSFQFSLFPIFLFDEPQIKKQTPETRPSCYLSRNLHTSFSGQHRNVPSGLGTFDRSVPQLIDCPRPVVPIPINSHVPQFTPKPQY